jgi:hypothetical protein
MSATMRKILAAKGGTMGEKGCLGLHGVSIHAIRDLLHAANLRHGTDSFTSPPKEVMLRIFLPLKIQWLQPGLNPRTWVLKASTLLLDHWSHSNNVSWTNNTMVQEKYHQLKNDGELKDNTHNGWTAWLIKGGQCETSRGPWFLTVNNFKQ